MFRMRNNGFTLIELLVVMSLGLILAAIAAPSFVDMTKNNRLNSAAREFQSIIQFARSEAITGNTIVNLYNTNINNKDKWDSEIFLCQAASDDTVCVSGTAGFIKKYSVGDLSSDGAYNNDINIDSNVDTFISFDANGRLSDGAITLSFCDNRTEGSNRDFQLLTISVTGRPSVEDLGVDLCTQT
jgi:prepilin-type N-terminal cleavage/methylation domain-containing protein